MPVWANFADFIYGQYVIEVCEAERNWRGKSRELIGQQQTNLSNCTRVFSVICTPRSGVG